jgi:hypothetical protein
MQQQPALACNAEHARACRQVTNVRVYKKDGPLFTIRYEDDDVEDVEEEELHRILMREGTCASVSHSQQPSSSTHGRKRAAAAAPAPRMPRAKRPAAVCMQSGQKEGFFLNLRAS